MYLSHLLVTRARMDPILTAFLMLELRGAVARREPPKAAQPLWDRVRHAGPHRQRARQPRFAEQLESPLDQRPARGSLKDFSAVYLSIGAINELSTLTGYGALIRKSGHPVLQDLLRRIIKDERRHFAFYYNSAKEQPTGNMKAQRVDRWML